MMRPNTWKKQIDSESETCFWIAPDGSKHPGTAEENAEVRAQLLDMRVKGDKIMREKSEKHF